MAGAPGSKVSLEARAAWTEGARRRRKARLARQALRDAFIVPVRERDLAGSGSALDDFKLFKESCKGKTTFPEESGLGCTRGICYSRRAYDDGKQGGNCRPGARAGAERGRRTEHDRNRVDRTVRGQLPGDSVDGWAAGFDRVAGGGAVGNAGCFCMVGAGRGNAESGRHVCFPARGVWPGTVGPVDVVLVRVANAGPGASFGGVGFDWF